MCVNRGVIKRQDSPVDCVTCCSGQLERRRRCTWSSSSPSSSSSYTIYHHSEWMKLTDGKRTIKNGRVNEWIYDEKSRKTTGNERKTNAENAKTQPDDTRFSWTDAPAVCLTGAVLLFWIWCSVAVSRWYLFHGLPTCPPPKGVRLVHVHSAGGSAANRTVEDDGKVDKVYIIRLHYDVTYCAYFILFFRFKSAQQLVCFYLRRNIF